MRKRKVTYPVAKTATRSAPPAGAGAEPRFDRPTVATIDLDAAAGRPGMTVGLRVRIAGTGLYSGEAAVIERLSGGVVPAAHVRTESGKTRQVRTIDLVPLDSEPKPEPKSEPQQSGGPARLTASTARMPSRHVTNRGPADAGPHSLRIEGSAATDAGGNARGRREER